MQRTITDIQRSTILHALSQGSSVLKNHAERLEAEAVKSTALNHSIQMGVANKLREDAADMDELYEELL